jgi:uncharacterized caspase-like protein
VTGGICRQRLLVGLLPILISVSFPALAEKRVALVIGNGSYKAQNLLVNPPNDAHLISKALNRAHFEAVETKTNLGIAEFRQALRRFQSQANGAEVALVYFAGHGLEVNGANWLIPTDADLSDDRDLDYEAIKADLVLQALQGARMRVLVLDACRDNPFGRNWRASVRSTTNGLAKLEADDVLVLFAAAPGRTASDGASSNSPFAEALANRLPEPGLAIQLLGGSVRDDVLATTGGNQRPYVSASITGKPFYLVSAEQPTAVATHSTPPKPPASDVPTKSSEAAEAWSLVKDTTDIRALEAFRRQYGTANPFFDRLAEARIEELRKNAEEVERQRVAMLQQIEEKAKTAEVEAQRRKVEEEARQRSEEEAKRKAEEAERPKPQSAIEGANAVATDFVDTHGLLGTWHCSGIQTQSTDGKTPGRSRISETININTFDGKYYWAESSHSAKIIGRGTALNALQMTKKSKYWFEGEKLYRLTYWQSDALAQQISKHLPPREITLKDNSMLIDYVYRTTYKGAKITGNFSGSCSKRNP